MLVFIHSGVDFYAVYAIYSAEVRIIDRVKKAALSHMLLESIAFMEPGEKLDKKFANLVLPADTRQCMSLINASFIHQAPNVMTLFLVPPPSSDEKLWWDTPGISSIVFRL